MKISVLAVAAMALALAFIPPAFADPEGEGRVKVKMDNTRAQSTTDELQGIVVLCARGDNACEAKDAQEKANKTKQYNQTDMDFVKERAK